jgi:hypothetical protein
MTQTIELEIKNSENVGKLSTADIEKVRTIFTALVTSGGLTGVKGGKTILHFDATGTFMGIELDYWPWRRRGHGV